MSLIHVDRTGYAAAAWDYLIQSVSLGRSYALYSANVACLELLGIVGRFDSLVVGLFASAWVLWPHANWWVRLCLACCIRWLPRAWRWLRSQRHTGDPRLLSYGGSQALGALWLKTLMVDGVRLGYLYLQIVGFAPFLCLLWILVPYGLCWPQGNLCQSICWWRQILQYLWCLLGVHNFGLYVWTLLIFGKVEVAMYEVRLKLEVWVKSLSISYLLSSALLTVPHRHNQIFQPIGRLALLFASSKQASVAFLFEMGEQGWVPLPLCCPAAARFLEALGLSLDTLILVGKCFTIATKSLVVAASLALLATSCSSTDFSLVAAAARLSNYPSRSFMPTLLPPFSVATSVFLRILPAAFAVPNLSDPSAACTLTRALACALL